MSTLSASRERRVRDPNLFRRVFRTGKRVAGPSFSIIWGQGARERKGISCDLVVKKGVSKRAVVRNRVKRLLREALRSDVDHFPTPQAGHVIVVAYKTPKELTLKAVQMELRQCLGKLHN